MIDLYQDQKEFISEIRECWRDHKRFIGFLPTGGGKTRCAAHIISGMNSRGKRVVFTVPRLSLLQQTLDSFADLGIYATVYHRDHEYTPSAPCVITTLQTMTRRGKVDADLYIVDEAHKRSKIFLDWMDEDPEMRVIGLTATPFPAWLGEYFTGIAKGKPMRWLIDNGRLADYDVYAADIPDLTSVKSRTDNNGDPDYVDSMLAEVMGDAKIVGNIVSTWLDIGENRPTICLCVNVMHANEIANQFEAAGITVDVITAKTKDREPRFQRFRDGLTKILLAVDTLTEGADFPFCSCLINARPTKSKCRYIQGLGRVLRYQEGKRAIIIDHSGDILRPNLGYPCSIAVDGLPTGDDGKKQNFSEVTKEEFERLPKLCKKCKFVKPAGVHVCPQCGFTPRAGQDIETAAEIGLKLISRTEADKPKKDFTMEDKQAYWSGLMGLRQQHINQGKNYQKGYYSNLYRERFDCWPKGLSDKAVAPSQEIIGKVKSKQIAWAKSKNNHKNKAAQ
jgi:DNA repair protein RadD